MQSYVDLVRQRFEDRHSNIEGSIDKLDEVQLRYTVRLFGDCLDEEKRKECFGNYSEYWTETEIREYVKNFLPAYTEYAISELIEKKKEGERFDPPWLTQEEYQEMGVREKWPKIAVHLDHMEPLQLRREIAKAALLFRPYMLSDPAFNEGAVEFALYFDIMDRLGKLSPGELRAVAGEIAPVIQEAVAARAPSECEPILRRVRETASRAAGIPADPEALLGPRMERYPREAPPGWKLRELRATLQGMNLKDLRLSALVHIDLLTTGETREIVAPFISRYPSFFGIPSNGLREIILAIADRISDRAISFFWDRYSTGRMAMTPPVSYLVWKLMPEEEKLDRLREDNAKMDLAMMSRHLGRYLHSSTPEELSDAGRQIALLTEGEFGSNHGLILKKGIESEARGVRGLYDEVTALSLRMATLPGEERGELYRKIRERISEFTGIPFPETTTEGGA